NPDCSKEVRRLRRRNLARVFALLGLSLSSVASAQSGLQSYRELAAPRLDPAQVYQVRDRDLDLPGMHLTLHDGVIAFARAQQGRTGYAYFEGDGEALVVPRSLVERKSLGLFTGNAVLEERFKTAYFAFRGGDAEMLQARLQSAIGLPDLV